MFGKKKVIPHTGEKKVLPTPDYTPYSAINFADAEQLSNILADRIETRFEELAHILLEYESYEVVLDEIERTLDLLRNLKENEEYFKIRTGAAAAFLPRNQPLYAFTCFVIIPSLMASEVHFRIPHSMKHFFPKLLALLEIPNTFRNIVVSHSPRAEFLRERSALRVNPSTRESIPVTEAVIFTGTPVHADQLRMIFDQRTLFITNGSGHNPVVVSKDADIRTAIEAVLTLQLYNQGQDCAAPNAVLVHEAIYPDFLRTLRDEIRAVRVGDYRDRKSRVGPISDPKDLVRVQDFLIDHRKWLDPTTPGIIRAYDAILEPTIITKPLKEGGNFNEIFAPAMFLQKYSDDSELSLYFEDPKYAMNAMYVTVFGSSSYVKNLIGRPIEGKILHDERSFLQNTHLHSHGAERGTEPYGGNGYGASNLSIDGVITPKATLPQRDIYEHVAKPLLTKSIRDKKLESVRGATEIVYKDTQKLMRLKSAEGNGDQDSSLVSETTYIDTDGIVAEGHRYTKLDEDRLHRLLEKPNADYIAKLELADLETIRSLRTLLLEESLPPLEEFATVLYAIAVRPGDDEKQKRQRQRQLFLHSYQLLFNKTSGPRLAEFLTDVDREHVCLLLDV